MLAIVSWYTTFEGMSLYLSRWFALLASLGVQSALLFVAWLIGFSRTRRTQLIVVYGITAVVSVAFSYVSLYRWFSERERPAMVRRQLYDRLSDSAAKTESTLASASAGARKHTLALEEMTQAEKLHGHISRAADTDPFLNRIRESVAREAQGVGVAYREGSGTGVRYTAFERHARLARESQQSIDTARASIANWRAATKPDEPADKQLRAFHAAFDAVPWSEVSDALPTGRPTGSLDKPEIPPLAEFVDVTSGGQEDLLLAFTELIAAPTPRHAFSFLLAAFMDIIIFLLAYASGPHLAGSPEQRMTAAAASLDALDGQVFTRDLLRKVTASPGALARLDQRDLSPGEQQFLLMLAARGQATQVDDDLGIHWLLDAETHAALLESLAERGLPLRASRAAAA